MKRKRKGFKSGGGSGGGKWNTKLPVTTRSNDRLLLLLNATRNNNSFCLRGFWAEKAFGVALSSTVHRSQFIAAAFGEGVCVYLSKKNKKRLPCQLSLSQSPSFWWLSIPTIWSLRLYWISLRCLIWWQSERIKAANWIQALNKTSCRQPQRHY